MISVRPAGRPIISDTINMINVKLCMMVVLTEHSLSFTRSYHFQ